MPALLSFDYAVLRVVPRVEREEFVNAGIVLFCRERDFLEAQVALDATRLLALHAGADLALIEQHLAAVPRIASGGDLAGPIGRLSQRERFHWLVAPRSTLLQLSPVHSGLCEEPALALAQLLANVVYTAGSSARG